MMQASCGYMHANALTNAYFAPTIIEAHIAKTIFCSVCNKLNYEFVGFQEILIIC